MLHEMFQKPDEPDLDLLRLEDRLFHLSIHEAAGLVAVDMWISGVFPDIREPDEWGGNDRDPMLFELLSEEIEQFESRLVSAIGSGRLKARNIVRDFDEKLVKGQPRISIGDLEAWLTEHHYTPGETFDQWILDERGIENRLEEELEYLRALSRDTKGVIEDLPTFYHFFPIRPNDLDDFKKENDIEKIIAAYKTMAISHHELLKIVYGGNEHSTKDHDAKIDRPVTVRNRRSMLTVIAAICKYGGLNPQDRGMAQRIMEMTDELGAHVDDGTIATMLSGIPEALRTRMK